MKGQISHQIERIDLPDARVTTVERAIGRLGRGVRALFHFSGVGREYFSYRSNN